MKISKTDCLRTPKADGFYMPGEFEPHEGTLMIWPWRPGSWNYGAKAARTAFAEIAEAIAAYEQVYLFVRPQDKASAQELLSSDRIHLIEAPTEDAWARDTGATFVVNDQGGRRGIQWDFNAWGGLVDGLYFPWDQDALVAQKVCELEGIDRYITPGFVLEGGSIHVDGEGTLITTEMCLLSSGRNPHMIKEQIEEKLKEYLNLKKIIWLKDGIDPDETNGHIDDVACFVRPGEVACIYTDDPTHPFYQQAQEAYRTLSEATDAKGRPLKVHKLCVTKKPCYLTGTSTIDPVFGSAPRRDGDLAIASYMNFLIVNGGIILPQYDDEHDALAIAQVQEMFPERKVVGVHTREIVYGGGNIHCITQHQPLKCIR